MSAAEGWVDYEDRWSVHPTFGLIAREPDEQWYGTPGITEFADYDGELGPFQTMSEAKAALEAHERY